MIILFRIILKGWYKQDAGCKRIAQKNSAYNKIFFSPRINKRLQMLAGRASWLIHPTRIVAGNPVLHNLL